MLVANCCARRLHSSAPREHNFPQYMQCDVFIVALSRHSLRQFPRGWRHAQNPQPATPLFLFLTSDS
jgi:hypothetical protein